MNRRPLAALLLVACTPTAVAGPDANLFDRVEASPPAPDTSPPDAAQPDAAEPDILFDAPALDAVAPDPAPDAPAPDAPADIPRDAADTCAADVCRRATVSPTLAMDIGGNTDQPVTRDPGNRYTIPYPLAANCTDDDVCMPVRGTVLNTRAQWPEPWPRARGAAEHAVGFVVGLTEASPPSPTGAGTGGLVVAGAPAGPTDRGQVSVYFVDPASADAPFDGSNEYGFIRQTGSQGRGQALVFFQQYSANTGTCQASAPPVDLAALGFDPTRVGSCLQVEVLPSGDFAVSQYDMTDGRCAGSAPGRTVSTVVENCTTRGTCRPTSRPATCRYAVTNINFYTGAGTHQPASAPAAPPAGTHGFLYGLLRKKAGEANVHAGSSLSVSFQLLQLL